MAKTGVTYEQVAEILDRDGAISTTQVRDILKTGSLGTLTVHRNRWLVEHQKPSTLPGADWAQQLMKIVELVGTQVTQEKSMLTDQVNSLKDDLDALIKENARLEKANEELQEEVRTSKTAVETVSRDLAKAQVRLEDYPEKIRSLEEALSEERHQREIAVTRVAVLEAEISWNKATLKQEQP
jgi:septal ring factor EnvC (AmiA/AmiB activator)